jgi:hypothetical protein
MQFLKNFNAGGAAKATVSTGAKNSYFSSLNKAYLLIIINE